MWWPLLEICLFFFFYIFMRTEIVWPFKNEMILFNQYRKTEKNPTRIIPFSPSSSSFSACSSSYKQKKNLIKQHNSYPKWFLSTVSILFTSRENLLPIAIIEPETELLNLCTKSNYSTCFSRDLCICHVTLAAILSSADALTVPWLESIKRRVGAVFRVQDYVLGSDSPNGYRIDLPPEISDLLRCESWTRYPCIAPITSTGTTLRKS